MSLLQALPRIPTELSMKSKFCEAFFDFALPSVHLSPSALSTVDLPQALSTSKCFLPWTISAGDSLPCTVRSAHFLEGDSLMAPYRPLYVSFSCSFLSQNPILSTTAFATNRNYTFDHVFIYCLSHWVASRKQLGPCLFLLTEHRELR